ncbi:MAG TPA: ImmA/IrrE family metallo-endopeptidase [Pyrinomonadaceae bacterium]|nr:ImmA/IrrE family metallo-endopeptidase [Pyrinomonadaceae bacterium]
MALAEEFFPYAPERIAEQLKIQVRRSQLNCDGWCLQADDNAIIRINSATTAARQRFTLAHELGHLILGIPAVVGESMLGNANRRSAEEREVDKLAASLLLPESKVLNEIKEVPITAAVIKKIARRARVSDIVVALRLANAASVFGLANASVVFYSNDKMVWQFSESLTLTEEGSEELLEECTEAFPMVARIPHEENQVIVASFLDNPQRNTKTVFLQLVPDSEGLKKLQVERLREAETELFKGDDTFRRSINGRFGSFKFKAEKLLIEEAVAQFVQKLKDDPPYMLKPQQVQLLLSPKGREYIRLKLQQWTKS